MQRMAKIRLKTEMRELSWFFSVIAPVLLHLAVSETVWMLSAGRLDQAAGTALSALLVLPAVLYLYVREQHKSSQSGGERFEKRKQKIVAAVCCFAGGGILNLLWSGLLNCLQIQNYFSNETQEALLSGAFWIQVAGPGILVPVTEELIFRGLVYGRMRMRMTAGQAVLFSSLFFSVWHGNPIQIIFSFPMALLMAFLRERGDSLLLPVLFHMGANLTAVLYRIPGS